MSGLILWNSLLWKKKLQPANLQNTSVINLNKIQCQITLISFEHMRLLLFSGHEYCIFTGQYSCLRAIQRKNIKHIQYIISFNIQFQSTLMVKDCMDICKSPTVAQFKSHLKAIFRDFWSTQAPFFFDTHR